MPNLFIDPTTRDVVTTTEVLSITPETANVLCMVLGLNADLVKSINIIASDDHGAQVTVTRAIEIKEVRNV